MRSKTSAKVRRSLSGKVSAGAVVTAAELGVIPEDNEGLIDHLRAVQGVIVAGT